MDKKVTPKDFFLWAGAMVALYGSVIALIALLFEYIDRTYPDSLEHYVDPYSGGIRFAMASLIVLVPVTIVLMRFIRNDIARAAEKAELWVRRWALVFTVFIAGAMVVGDLIALINTFLGGDLTTRFILKILVVLFVAGGVFLHFLADLRGYWNTNPARAKTVGLAVGILMLAVIIAGFFIMGTPGEVRLHRFDDQKVSDLQNIQWQVVNFWQQKKMLPATLDELIDPIGGNYIPVDSQTGERDGYTVMGPLSFELCATFNTNSRSSSRVPNVPLTPYVDGVENDNWLRDVGKVCFSRTIDPERYPPFEKALLR